MYHCTGCDHSFSESELTEYPGDELDETYLGCPFCTSPNYRDLVSAAEMLEDR